MHEGICWASDFYCVVLSCASRQRESPFPKRGWIRLVVAAVVSVVLSTVLSMPISAVIAIARSGAFSDFSGWIKTIQADPQAAREMMNNLSEGPLMGTPWNMVDMLFGAALLEEGLKFLTCRIAIRKKGMVRTWMDSVVAFAFVGITFEMIENVAFGGAGLLNVILRACAPAHFVFGVIMGYFYGKYLVSGQKRFRLLSFVIPVVYHTITNALMVSMDLSKFNQVIGSVAAISHIIAGIVTVILIIRWQKNRKLDVPLTALTRQVLIS